MHYASAAIAIAEAEIGYLEKASNSNLDSKTANAGSKNYTKFARDLAAAGFFNGSKQGYPWCAVFVVWVIWMLCGKDKEKTLAILCQTGPYGAGCGPAVQYYKQSGRFHTDDPKPGDQIFFWDAKRTYVAHTGMVVDVDDTYVYTIEGNTSGASGVVENGGGVRNKRYELDYSRIYGYGSPKYDEEPKATTTPTTKEGFTVKMATLKSGSKHAHVKVMQMLLIGNGYSCGPSGPDGKFGPATKKAVGEYQEDHKDTDGKPLTVDYICGPKMWGSLLKQ